MRRYSDITFTYVVPVVEVYLNAAAADAEELAALAPPWSATPWHVMVLMEEAVKRGVGAFSAAEARRRGVRWLDLARDPKTREELGAILDGLARAEPRPGARSSAWWRPTRRRPAGPRCAQFAQRRGHYLVTNGPYQLEKWTDGGGRARRVPRHEQPARASGASIASPSRGVPTSRASPRVAIGWRSRRRSSGWRSSSASTAWSASRWAPAPARRSGRSLPACRYVVLGADGDGGRRRFLPRRAGPSPDRGPKGRLKPGAVHGAGGAGPGRQPRRPGGGDRAVPG